MHRIRGWPRRQCRRWIVTSASVALVCWALHALAAEATSDVGAAGAESPESVVLGMSAALSGPTSNLGLGMRAGVQAALSEANQAAHSRRQFKLIALDDGYEPTRTVPNMRRLIEKEEVVAVIGNVGTPPAVAAIPIANQSKTPLVGAFTGAGVLRKNPPDRYVINYRASYAEETAAMVDALVTLGGIRTDQIGFFIQRDSFGDAGFAGGIAALKRHGVHEVNSIPHGGFERNTTNVESGLADLLVAPVPIRAVIMVGTAAPCAAFIKAARQAGLHALFLNVSFVNGDKLAELLGPYGEGVIVTQVVPHLESSAPIVMDYRQALAALNESPEPGCVSLEGYVAARMLLRAIDDIEGPVSREAIVAALERLGEFDLGLGEGLRLNPDEHQACHRVWPTMISDGKITPIGWTHLRALE